MKIHLLSAVLLSALLAACGGDNKNGSSPASSSPSGNQPSSAAAQTSSQAPASSAQATSSIASPVVGVLVDAFVAGIGYRTQTQSGVTNERGEFNYLPGETVTFFIGALEFPPVPAKQIVTPLDMGQTTNPEVAMVVNIARLLQSLDSDSDPTNGISIDAAAAQAATAVDFNLSIEAFAASTAVVNLVANSGSNTKALVAIEDAITHLRETLTNVGVPVDGSSSSASSVVVVPASSAPASSAPASSVPASSVPASSSAVSSVVVVPASSAPASSAPASSVPASSVASSPEPSSAASSSSVIAVPSAFDSADGWASVGVNNLGYPGTNGGVTADQAHTYTVTNRNELLAALYTNLTINDDGSFSGTVDTTPKIIYVDGTINMNMNKALVENTEADYVCPIDGNSIKVAYDFNDYVAFYDPNGAWGTAPVSGDLEAARACAANKQKAVIQIKVGSNTTIIGLGDNAKIVRGHIRLSSPYDNIIIRNVHFEDAFDMFPQWDPTDSGGRWNSAYDNISIDGATHVWIDHCTFNDGANLDKLHPPVFAAPYNLPEMKVQHHDGAIDITKNANYVTLSHNYVHDHDKTHLVGSSDSIAVDNGPQFLKLTMHHNLFKDVTQRLPRVRMGMVHVYNNVYDGQLKPIDSDRNYAFSVGLATGQFGKIYAENNVFNIEASTDQVEATVHNLYSVSFKQDSGTIAACTNAGYNAADCSTLFYASGTLLNGQPVDVMTAAVNYAAGLATPLTLNSAASYWTPASYYSYALDNADGLANTIIAAAGAGKCSDCLNTDKPVQIPASSSAASSSSAPASASSSSAASSEAPIAMNCGADVYFCDDFSAETAAYWNLLPVAGPVGSFDLFTQNSNQMLRYTAGSAGGVLALVKPAAFTGVTSGDYYVEARIRPRNNSTTGNKQLYVIARAQDANNWYGAGFNVQAATTSTRVAIGKMVGGVFTDNIFSRYNTPIEQGTAGGSDGTWYTLRIEFKGSAIVVYLNGAPVISGTDTSFSAAGLIGLYTTNKSFEIDDVKVGNADSKPVQFTVAPSITSYVAEAGDLPTSLTVTAKNTSGETDSFTAESSDNTVVQVSINGNQVSLTPVGGGTASITLTSGSDPSKTHVINASIAPEFVQPSQTYDLTGRVDPAVNEASAHVDTRLSITFDAPPTLGSSGRIRIYKTSDDTVVDTITLSDNTDTLGFSGQGSYRIVKTSPLSISGNTLTIAPDNSKLAYNTSYYVAIAEGVVTGASLNGSEFVGLGKAAGWSFTTKTAAPATGDVTVDDNGPADFRTVQGAINHVVQTVARDTPATISIKNGDYRELLFLRGKNNLTLQGESREGVVIHYTNNEGINSGTGASQAAGSPAGGRSVFLVETSDLLKLDSLTLKNDTLIGSGGQAEVIYFNNDTGRLLATNANFISEQDTIQVKGYSWFYRSLIAGNVDFIWGNNRVALFEESEIRSLGDSRGNGSGGYILQARTVTAADKGFVFLNSSLTRGPGPLNHEIADNQTWLARSGGSVSYFDNIVFINTKMDAHIRSAGWNTSPLPNPVIATATSGWREFASMNLAGDTLDVSGRVADSSYQLSLGEVASSYCNRAQIFAAYNNGAGWNPLPGDTTDCINFGQSSSSSSSSFSAASSNASSNSDSSNHSTSSAESSASSAASSDSSSSSSSSSAAVVVTKIWGFDSAAYAAADTNLFAAAYNPAADNGIKITGGDVAVDGLIFNSTAAGVLRYRPAGSANNATANALWNTNGSFFTSNSVMMPAVGESVASVRTYFSIPVEAGKAFTLTVHFRQTGAGASAAKVALVGSDNLVLAVADATFATAGGAEGSSITYTSDASHAFTAIKFFYGREGLTTGGVNINHIERVQ